MTAAHGGLCSRDRKPLRFGHVFCSSNANASWRTEAYGCRDIFITEEDHDKLMRLLEGARQRRHRDLAHVEQLGAELDRAHIVPASEIPPDVVTMYSRVALRDLDTGDEIALTLVLPHEANVDQRKVSVLAPLERPSWAHAAATSSNGRCQVAHDARSSACCSSRKLESRRSRRWSKNGR
jgi:hypothetical protein